MTHRFLEDQISLLLSEFGNDRVLTALSSQLGYSDEELRNRLRERLSTPISKKPSRPSIDKALDIIQASHAEKGRLLREIISRFQRKEFLPTLRDTQKFFDTQTGRRSKIEGRSKATARLLKILSEMSLEDLEKLLQSRDRSDYSALSIISNEILRRS